MALTRYVTAMTAGVANTKGSYAQVVASSPYDSSRMHIICTSSGATVGFVLVDIATGAASSEIVKVSNIAVQIFNFIYGENTIIDVDIPAGSRIAVRAQSNVPSAACTFVIHLEDRALGSLTNPVTYGANTATSKGTTVDPGGTVSTKGSYAQITASTTADIDALMICVVGPASGVGSFITWTIDIAIGAASSETIIIPDITLVDNPSGNVPSPQPGWLVFPISITTGTRLAARCSSNNNTAGSRELSIVLIGMQEPTPSALLAGESTQFLVVMP